MPKKEKDNIIGILLLDKPVAITSNDALQTVKHLYSAEKAGHTGSLDPLASGMLPICFGEATKFASFLLDNDKRYLVTAKLGVKTATGDAEGDIISTHEVPPLSEKDIEQNLKNFRGNIEQIPSMYSAIKHQGQPLYKLARKGISVERAKRPVTIYQLDLIAKPDEETLQLYIHSSKGTYVRTLIEDIGEALGCGAHVTSLRRLTVGLYQEQQMVALNILEKLAQQEDRTSLHKLLLPIESMFSDWKEVSINESLAYYLRRGQSIIVPYSPTSGWVRLKLKSGQFLGVGEVLSNGKIAPRRLINH